MYGGSFPGSKAFGAEADPSAASSTTELMKLWGYVSTRHTSSGLRYVYLIISTYPNCSGVSMSHRQERLQASRFPCFESRTKDRPVARPIPIQALHWQRRKRVHWTLRENGQWDNKYRNNFTKSFNYEQDFPGRWQKHEMSINFVFVLSSHVRVPPKTKVLLYTDRLRDEATASFFNKSCTQLKYVQSGT